MTKINTLKESYKDLKNQSEQCAKDYYNSSLETQKLKLDNDIKAYKEKIKKDAQIFEEECNNSVLKKKQELAIIEEKVKQLEQTVDSALEVEKRKNEVDKYKLHISEKDISDVQKLRALIPSFNNKEILGKLIYKTYYEKPYTDLINRLFGTNKPCGIYKITEIGTEKCYIGQSVNVAERFRQHIKCGTGADIGAQNKLYAAMLEKGVENFTFELVEECDRAKLTEREDYWQEFYQAIQYGYSIK